ncbi:hypothetical protein PRZ48_011895 [Zasmidium cellare]|uniref:F-box domain-containing protein n=1 Tax=Zasmidium cellare TaxID=395010 RepID=A0ABR0E7Z1_ZASCE|nr:hypothetical protein PRZ48_011895 [Zasmidium cellare]
MAALPKPAPPVKVTSTSKEKHKKSFLDLPQELRDHIYSFLRLHPRGLGIECFRYLEGPVTAMRLGQTCRAIRTDMESAFWASIKCYWSVLPSRDPSEFNHRWITRNLAFVENFYLTFSNCVRTDDWSYGVSIHLLKKDGEFTAVLEPFEGKIKCFGERRAERRNDEEARAKFAKRREIQDIAIGEKVLEYTQPFLDLARCELKERDASL